MSQVVFVFGSNTEGRHGAGAAYHAYTKYGAIYGKASGRQGNAYAIITKDLRLGRRSIPLPHIEAQVRAFLAYASSEPSITFLVSPIGCGLAGYTPSEIGPMFKNAPKNVQLPDSFVPFVN